MELEMMIISQTASYPTTPAWCEIKMREMAMAMARPKHKADTKIPLFPTRQPPPSSPPPVRVSGIAENARRQVLAPKNTWKYMGKLWKGISNSNCFRLKKKSEIKYQNKQKRDRQTYRHTLQH